MTEAGRPIGRYTDDELRGRVFEIEDPRDQENYVEIIPEGAQVVDCETFYDLKSWRYPCGISSCRTKHMRGFGVLLDNGQRSNIGHNCGSKHFGSGFEEMKSRMEYNARRANFLRRREPLNRVIGDALDLLKEWRGPMREVATLRNNIRRLSGSLFKELTAMYQRQGGVPMVSRRIRDRAAEQRRDERIKEDHPQFGKPIYQETEQALSGRLPGQLVFGSLDPSRGLSDVVVDLTPIISKSEKDTLTNSELLEVFNLLGRCIERLERLADIHEDAAKFCTSEVWKTIAEWQQETRPGESIIWRGYAWATDRDGTRLEMPTFDTTLDRTPIEVLKQRPDLETVQ